MRTNLMSPLWLVFALVLPQGCGASDDSVSVGELSSECAEEPGIGQVISRSPPEPRALPGLLLAHDSLSPTLGPLADFPVVPADTGYLCRGDAECMSGHCFDGVCCASPCGGVCEACNLPGLAGFCTFLPEGANPRSECGVSGCFAGSQEVFSCDGAGACQVKVDPCRPYACGEVACNVDCRGDADCVEGAHCVAEKCVL